MTRAPYVQLKPEAAWDRGNRELVDTTLGWRFVNPRLAEQHYPYSMGETAENVAERWGVSRERQDAFALESQRRAVAAIEAGRFDDQIVPISVPQRKGDPVVVDARRAPARRHDRRGARPTAAGVQAATAGPSPPATRPGSTTARRRSCSSRRIGPASSACGRWRASSRRRSPASTRRSWAIGPVPATRKALDRAGIGVDDLDLIELNEAFASQSIAVHRRARARSRPRSTSTAARSRSAIRSG